MVQFLNCYAYDGLRVTSKEISKDAIAIVTKSDICSEIIGEVHLLVAFLTNNFLLTIFLPQIRGVVQSQPRKSFFFSFLFFNFFTHVSFCLSFHQSTSSSCRWSTFQVAIPPHKGPASSLQATYTHPAFTWSAQLSLFSYSIVVCWLGSSLLGFFIDESTLWEPL